MRTEVSELVAYATSTATQCVGYARDTAVAASAGAKDVAHAAASRAAAGVERAAAVGRGALDVATTTVVAHAPTQIVQLVQAAAESCRATAQDPVGVAKNYIPAFVIHFGERSYEVAIDARDRAVARSTAARGVIIERVSGVVDRIVSVPQVHTLLERLETLAMSVLSRFGITKSPLGYILHDHPAGSPASPASSSTTTTTSSSSTTAAVSTKKPETKKTQ